MKVVFIKLIFLLVVLLPLSAQAQKTLRGIVRDQVGPMVGVTVCIVNAEGRVVTGVASNMNGEYVIRVPEASGLRVEVSFVGYKTQKVNYQNQTVLNFTLEENVTALDEVLITAKAVEKNTMGVDNRDLGVARQKIDLDEYLLSRICYRENWPMSILSLCPEIPVHGVLSVSVEPVL